MQTLNIDDPLLAYAKKLDKIVLYTVMGGGFEVGHQVELLGFEDEASLAEWASSFAKEEKEADNEESPWTLTEEFQNGHIYKITSDTDCRPWETGWECTIRICVYYPDRFTSCPTYVRRNTLASRELQTSLPKGLDQREPKKTLTAIHLRPN